MPVETSPQSGAAASGSGFAVKPEHVASLVAGVLRKKPDATAIGIHVTGTWLGKDQVMVDGRPLRVEYCPSALAVSEALDRSTGEQPVVVLTSVPEEQLGWGVLVRLARTRLHRMAPWEILQDQFRARDIDPRLTSHRWVAEALLEHMPSTGYPPVPSGVLDADTAWNHLGRELLGLRTGRPDGEALLAWSTDPLAVARYERLAEEVRSAFRVRVQESAGRVGELMLDALDAGRGQCLLAIGLVCEVLFAEGTPAGSELGRAAVRLEPYLGGIPIEPPLGRRWFTLARRVLEDTLTEPQVQAVFKQADTLLHELRAESFVGLSSVLPGGYHRRLESFGRALASYLSGSAPLNQVEASFAEIEAHYAVVRGRERERVQRIEMALRLARLLEVRRGGPSPSAASLGRGARTYAGETSFVDWARTHLLGGEQGGELAAALETLFSRVRSLREQENRAFAERLAQWNRSPAPESGLVPVERVLDELVAPLAARAPVLLLVLDGMDFVIFRELNQELRDQGWLQWLPTGWPEPPVVLSALPSATRFSRASLFAGRVQRGASADEKRAFAAHAGLRAASPKRAPVLFHKAELTEGSASALAEPVRTALQDPEQRVVGLVLNAADDFLARSEQVRPGWSIDRIRLLQPVLYEAMLGGRTVVLTSDHGHILEAGSQALGTAEDAEAERWRPFTEPVAEEEIVLEGPRVQAATGMERIIVPWSEAVRYVRKKAGYHGGATPQEVLVPLAVLGYWDRRVEGWQPVPEHVPAWWAPAEAEPGPAPEAPAPEALRRRMRAPEAQASLFAEPVELAGPPAAPAGPHWIPSLLHRPTYQAQRAMAGRLAPADDVVRSFLELMERSHNRLPRAALARALGVPELRVRGLIAGLQRLLNVDGYPVVTVDDATDTVELQRELLRKQFEV